MTRFHSTALPSYTPIPRESPLAGIWSMLAAYYAMSPAFREKLAGLFAAQGPSEEELSDASRNASAEMEGYVPSQVLDETGTDLVTNPMFMGRDLEGSTKRATDLRRDKLIAGMPKLESGSWLDDKLAYDASEDMRGYATGWMQGYNPNLRGGHR